MRSRFTVPAGAVSSGLHVLSADGSTCERLVTISPHFAVGSVSLVVLTTVIYLALKQTWGVSEPFSMLVLILISALCEPRPPHPHKRSSAVLATGMQRIGVQPTEPTCYGGD